MQSAGSIPKISFVVPIYNGEKYLERCVSSIQSQTFTDYEIILVNDGSTDNSLSLCQKFAANDSKITVLSKENGGQGSARNAGIEIAKGEYITFPDVDDWIEPDMCEDMYNLARKGDYDVAIAGANNYSQELKLINSVHYDCISLRGNKECFANIMTFLPTTLLFDVVWNKIYRRDFLIHNGLKFSNLRRTQDAYFNLEVFDCIESLITTDKAYYNYLNNEAEQVNKKFPINYIDINILYYKKLKSIFESRGMYCDRIKHQYDSSFVETIYATINMFDNPRWGLNRNEQKRYILDILNREEISEYLINPSIREDVVWKYEIIKEKDLNRILRIHRKEQLKDRVRNNKLLMSIYHSVR